MNYDDYNTGDSLPCCNGYIYYDGRCGDGKIAMHDKNCPVGKQEEMSRRYWEKERR